MDGWHGFRFHQLVEVPRDAEPDRRDGRDATTRALLAAVTGSHSALLDSGDPAASLVTGWIRGPGDRAVRLLAGGRPVFPPAVATAPSSSSRRRVLFPPAALAVDVDSAEASRLLAAFRCWLPCPVRADALWLGSEPDAAGSPRRGSFDRFAAHLSGPFAWLVLAQPLLADDALPELDTLVNDIGPLSRGEVSESKRIDLERKRARYRELRRWQTGGLWRVRVLAGGPDRGAAANAAAMLCAASDLDGLPYALTPAIEPLGPAGELTAGTATNPADAGWFTASAPLVVALTRPPDRELPGLRVVEPHTFDVTPEPAVADGLLLGSIRDAADADVGDLRLTLDAINRHVFVCGATGAGKSQTVRHLLQAATSRGLPWLVVEPAKAEYARMAARIAATGGEVIVIRPHHSDSPPAGLNPLEPAPGFPLQTHVDLLRALFLAAFEAQEPFPQILAAALTRCYEELGWDLTLGEPALPRRRPRYPTLGDLQRVAERVVQEIGYGPEVAANVRGFIAVRLGSLRLGTIGRFFEGGHPIDFDRLRTRNVVLEIEDVGDDADKAFLMGAILMRLVEHLRVAARRGHGSARLGHLTVVEEAHRLLRRPDGGTSRPAVHAVEMFAALLAEVRAYGEGLIVVDQIPSKLIPETIKNTAVKIVHRLPASDDRDSVGATMNLDKDQSRYLVTLVPGEAAVFAEGADHPLLVRIPDGTGTETDSAVAGPSGSIRDIVGRRSATCGAECVDQPCTLRQMRAAQHALGAAPWLALWAELAVLAHLAGHPTPRPHPDVRDSLRLHRVSSRILDCAVSHAVDDAVAVRSTVLHSDTDPAALATHVCSVLREVLDGGADACRSDAMRYLAPPYRWEQVRYTLATAEGGGDGPDPRTPEWERRHRRRIPGANRAEQLAAVTAWLAADHRDTTARDAVTYGSRRPSTLESVIGGPAPDDGWSGRVTNAVGQFVDCTWPLMHLAPTADRAS